MRADMSAGCLKFHFHAHAAVFGGGEVDAGAFQIQYFSGFVYKIKTPQ